MLYDSTVIGNLIRERRIEKGLSQEQLADKANISRTHVGALERGEKAPSLETIINIAEALSVDINELLPENPASSKKSQDTLAGCSTLERSILSENLESLKEILRKHKI